MITVDEPSICMTIGINTSPLAGQATGDAGTKLTARLLKGRLDAELVGNVSIRVLPTERPDTWEVQGRGELALAVLVEMMRREGFELTVGKPQVLTREIDGKVHEPVERVSVDVPEELPRAWSPSCWPCARAAWSTLVNHGTRLVPHGLAGAGARPRSGFRTEFLTETRGTGSCTTSSTAGSPGTASCAPAPTGRWWPTGAAADHGLRPDEPAGARGRCSSAPASRSTRG